MYICTQRITGLTKIASPFIYNYVKRQQSTLNYYNLFKKTFPDGPPPASSFDIDEKKLRKEYRSLQSQNHPDLIQSLAEKSSNDGTTDISSYINKAYNTLKSPLTRSQYLLSLKSGIDLSKDETAKEFQFKDQGLLMEILEIHEDLENIKNEEDLSRLVEINDQRIESTVSTLNQLYKDENYEAVAIETIKLKYWFNIKNALNEWEAGKPIQLTH